MKRTFILSVLTTISLVVLLHIYGNDCQKIFYAVNNLSTKECLKYIEVSDSLECRNDDGFTPLLEAIYVRYLWREGNEKEDIIVSLLTRGANVNANITSDSEWWDRGDTPLHIVSQRGELNIAKKLIEYGADINARNIYGETPIMKACQMNEIETAEYLISKGANINLKDNEGANILLHCANSSSEKYELIKLLLDRGIDVNSEDIDGVTALIQAAGDGHYKTAKMLLERGAEINHQTRYTGVTALMMASFNTLGDKKEIVKLLLESGANIELKNKDGETAYYFALESGNYEIAVMLASAGANTVPQNRLCKKILKAAKKKGYNPINYHNGFHGRGKGVTH